MYLVVLVIIMRYLIKQVGTKDGFACILINLDQLKALYMVDHRYLGAVLKASDFGLAFKILFTAMPSDACSVIKVKSHLLELFGIVG